MQASLLPSYCMHYQEVMLHCLFVIGPYFINERSSSVWIRVRRAETFRSGISCLSLQWRPCCLTLLTDESDHRPAARRYGAQRRTNLMMKPEINLHSNIHGCPTTVAAANKLPPSPPYPQRQDIPGYRHLAQHNTLYWQPLLWEVLS